MVGNKKTDGRWKSSSDFLHGSLVKAYVLVETIQATG